MFSPMKYLKAAFVAYSISQTAVDFNGGGIDKIKQELNEKGYVLASIAFVATNTKIECSQHQLRTLDMVGV